MVSINRIKELREALNIGQKKMALDLHVTQPTVSNWELGYKVPSSKSAAKLADYFGVSIDYLLNRRAISNPTPAEKQPLLDPYSLAEKQLIKTFRKASKYAKKIAILVLETSDGTDADDTKIGQRLYPIDYYPDYPVSAGHGNFIDETQKEVLQLIKEPPRGACLVNRISGDSMEPKYKDGDKVFVSPDPAERGQIAICIYESEAYIKKIGDHELISLNPAYPPIKVTNPESFFCVGTVLGKCDQSYFENDV